MMEERDSEREKEGHNDEDDRRRIASTVSPTHPGRHHHHRHQNHRARKLKHTSAQWEKWQKLRRNLEGESRGTAVTFSPSSPSLFPRPPPPHPHSSCIWVSFGCEHEHFSLACPALQSCTLSSRFHLEYSFIFFFFFVFFFLTRIPNGKSAHYNKQHCFRFGAFSFSLSFSVMLLFLRYMLRRRHDAHTQTHRNFKWRGKGALCVFVCVCVFTLPACVGGDEDIVGQTCPKLIPVLVNTLFKSYSPRGISIIKNQANILLVLYLFYAFCKTPSWILGMYFSIFFWIDLFQIFNNLICFLF